MLPVVIAVYPDANYRCLSGHHIVGFDTTKHHLIQTLYFQNLLIHKMLGRCITGSSVILTSKYFSFAMLVLLMVGNQKVQRWNNL
jgi:hypothetical protein